MKKCPVVRGYVVHTGVVGSSVPNWPNYGKASILTPQDFQFPGVLVEGHANQAGLIVGVLDLEFLRHKREPIEVVEE